MGGKRPVGLRHRMRGKLQKLPVAMPAATGSSWQEAEIAKWRVMGAVFDMPGPLQTSSTLSVCRSSNALFGHSPKKQSSRFRDTSSPNSSTG